MLLLPIAPGAMGLPLTSPKPNDILTVTGLEKVVLKYCTAACVALTKLLYRAILPAPPAWFITVTLKSYEITIFMPLPAPPPMIMQLLSQRFGPAFVCWLPIKALPEAYRLRMALATV